LTDTYSVWYVCLDPHGDSVHDVTGTLLHIGLNDLVVHVDTYREHMKCPLYEHTYNFQYQTPDLGYITAKVNDTS